MPAIQSLRGTKDIIGDDARLWDRIEDAARSVFDRFGFEPIRFPILEEAALFRRSVGEVTDIVQKEMYHFKDRSDLDIALRPEGTAGIVRSIIEHHLQKAKPVNKFYYFGPMFRAERPQAGRLRQFHQVGVEIFGSDSPYADVESMEVLVRFLEALNIGGWTLHINSLGTPKEREAYSESLADYFKKEKSRLCEDCQDRLKRNVLRILDCKKRSCEPLIGGAPSIKENLSRQSRDIFDEVRQVLDLLKIPYEWNTRIVRGLDYYTHTVYELTHPALGSQDALAAGGRYDDLVAKLGGEKTPAVGFALGVERLILTLERADRPARAEASGDAVTVIAVSQACQDKAYGILSAIRGGGVAARMDFENRSVKAQMRQANKSGSRLAVILGEDELKEKKVLIKDMTEGSDSAEEIIAMSDIVNRVRERLGHGSNA